MRNGIRNAHVGNEFISLEMFQAGFKRVQGGLGESVRKHIGDIAGKAEKVKLGVIVSMFFLGG